MLMGLVMVDAISKSIKTKGNKKNVLKLPCKEDGRAK